uniref:polynucleotide adenylyltransferase n=1 Tax=Heterorhabditis bacteriophora TaxID=37862 RepID=A0A1I7XM62_HETBA
MFREWPHPVLLKDLDHGLRPDIQNLQELVWDPRIRGADRFHLMPILTPAFPEQNSTFNVTNSTRTILMNEMKEALICAAKNEEDHLIFCGFVESKIRHLIGTLERNQGISLAHINPRQYKPLPTANIDLGYENPVCTLWFIGLEFDRNMAKAFDLTVEISQFHHLIATTGVKMKAYNEDMKVDLQYVRRADIGHWVMKEDYIRGRHAFRRPVIMRTSSGTGTGTLVSFFLIEYFTSLMYFLQHRVDSSSENLSTAVDTLPPEPCDLHNVSTTSSEFQQREQRVVQNGNADNVTKEKNIEDVSGTAWGDQPSILNNGSICNKVETEESKPILEVAPMSRKRASEVDESELPSKKVMHVESSPTPLMAAGDDYSMYIPHVITLSVLPYMEQRFCRVVS